MKLILLILHFFIKSILSINIHNLQIDQYGCKVLSKDIVKSNYTNLLFWKEIHNYYVGMHLETIVQFKSTLEQCQIKCLDIDNCYSIDYCHGICHLNGYYDGEFKETKSCNAYILILCGLPTIYTVQLPQNCTMLDGYKMEHSNNYKWFIIKSHYVPLNHIQLPTNITLNECREQCYVNINCFSFDYCKGYCYMNGFFEGEIIKNSVCDAYFIMKCDIRDIYHLNVERGCEILKKPSKDGDRYKFKWLIMKNSYVDLDYQIGSSFESTLKNCKERCLLDRSCFSFNYNKQYKYCYINRFFNGTIGKTDGVTIYLLMYCEYSNVENIPVEEGCERLLSNNSKPTHPNVLKWIPMENSDLITNSYHSRFIRYLEDCMSECINETTCYSIEYTIFGGCFFNRFTKNSIFPMEHRTLYFLVNCENMFYYKKKKYLMIGKHRYHEAQKECQKREYTLFLPKDSETILYVKKKISEREWGIIWIDANDLKTEGVFMDSIGQNVTYLPWSPGEPNNFKNMEHCAGIYFLYNGGFNDIDCYFPIHTLCEKEYY